VLLAEDNATNAWLISEFLRAQGFRVEIARDGREAVAMASSSIPDVVLMDIQMPVMDGIEAVRLLRSAESTRRLPVVAVTALAMPGDAERRLAAGADHYLAKPVELRGLLALVRRLVAERPAGGGSEVVPGTTI
jgi:CheY-like chemotaxis protein